MTPSRTSPWKPSSSMNAFMHTASILLLYSQSWWLPLRSRMERGNSKMSSNERERLLLIARSIAERFARIWSAVIDWNAFYMLFMFSWKINSIAYELEQDFCRKITSEPLKHNFKKSRHFILHHRPSIHRKTFSTYSPRVATESLNSIRKPNADFTSLHYLMCCHQRT